MAGGGDEQKSVMLFEKGDTAKQPGMYCIQDHVVKRSSLQPGLALYVLAPKNSTHLVWRHPLLFGALNQLSAQS